MHLIAFCKKPCPDEDVVEKWGRMIKITTLFLFIGCLQLSARTQAQGISLVLNNAPIEKAFDQIEKQTAYSFVFANEQLQLASRITISVKNAPLEKILELCFKDQPLSYSIENNHIIVSAKEERIAAPLPVDSNGSVTGRVSNERGELIAAVSIVIKGSHAGTITNGRGEFTLANVRPGAVLLITSIGYEAQEITIGNNRNLEIHLQTIASGLDEMLVKGYYSTSKRLNTGSVGTVSSGAIEKQPVSNVLSALSGRIPGVYIQQKSGLPGANIYLEIRGRNSIGSATDPLYIIDGVPFTSRSINSPLLSSTIYREGVSPLSNINPADIESIEVLKDADATAIYGSRGANGVVIITTKQGKPGKTTVDANVYAGSGKVSHMMELLNTREYIDMRKEAFSNDGVIPSISTARDLLEWDTTKYTDWQKKMIGGTAHFFESRLSVSGGNEGTQFIVSGDYRKESTVFPGNYPSVRGSAIFSMTHLSANKKFKINFSANYLSNVNHLLNEDLTSDGLLIAPNAPDLADESGHLLWPVGIYNSLAFLKTKYSSATDNFIANAVVSYTILPGLSAKSSTGYTQMSLQEFRTNPLSSFNPAWGYSSSDAYTDFGTNSLKTWIIEPQLVFNKKIKKGVLDVIAGMTFQQNIRQGQTLHAAGFASEALMENPGSATTSAVTNSVYAQYKYDALFGRIGYTLKDRYLINLTGRRDGSSRFGPGRQFGNFGAVGLGWIFSKEKLVQQTLPVLSYGKLRISYGTTGNDQIGDYQFLDLWQSTPYPYAGRGGLYPTRIVNENFSWESSCKLDVALETGFFHDRVQLMLDYYLNRTDNQLVGFPLPPSTGTTSVQSNFNAVVENKGLEIDLTTVNIKNKTITWSTAFNLTIPRNRLVNYPGIDNTVYSRLYTVGKPLSILKSYHYLGVDPNTGVFQFEDANKDGKLTNPADFQSIKNISQKLYGGFENTVSAFNFQLDVFIQFVQQTGTSYLGAFNAPGYMSNQPAVVLSRWQHSGDHTDIQKFTQGNGNAYDGYINTVYYGDNRITDASFIRLKNVALSYQLPAKAMQRMHLQKVKLYIQGQNLVTKTNYLGLDPENQNAFSLPSLRMYVAGIQLTL